MKKKTKSCQNNVKLKMLTKDSRKKSERKKKLALKKKVDANDVDEQIMKKLAQQRNIQESLQ